MLQAIINTQICKINNKQEKKTRYILSHKPWKSQTDKWRHKRRPSYSQHKNNWLITNNSSLTSEMEQSSRRTHRCIAKITSCPCQEPSQQHIAASLINETSRLQRRELPSNIINTTALLIDAANETPATCDWFPSP